MKKVISIMILFIMIFIISPKVYAYSKDIEVKVEKTTNVTLKKGTINNNSISLTMDDYSFQISSSLNNLEVIIIKVENEAYDYINSKTNSNQNYYISFYQNNQKVSNPKAKIKITNDEKMLNVFNNEGELLYKDDKNISLDKNDYFITVTDKVNLQSEKFLLIDEDTSLEEISNIVVNSGATVEVYNSKNEKININSDLGTDYRVVIKNGDEINEYIIITDGDVTGDAEINFFDVTKLYHYTKGMIDLKETFEIAGDFARDGSIDFIDVTKLYHYTKGITPEV